MAAAEDISDQSVPKKGKMGVILTVIAALACGAGGFFAAFTGAIPLGSAIGKAPASASDAPTIKPLHDTVYVGLEPLIVNIRSSSHYDLLRFVGQLEVLPEHAADIEQLKPRIVDVMNTYLNALEAGRFEDPVAMMKLRAQLLRRIQIVTGEGRVQDLLIMEFLLQ